MPQFSRVATIAHNYSGSNSVVKDTNVELLCALGSEPYAQSVRTDEKLSKQKGHTTAAAWIINTFGDIIIHDKLMRCLRLLIMQIDRRPEQHCQQSGEETSGPFC